MPSGLRLEIGKSVVEWIGKYYPDSDNATRVFLGSLAGGWSEIREKDRHFLAQNAVVCVEKVGGGSFQPGVIAVAAVELVPRMLEVQRALIGRGENGEFGVDMVETIVKRSDILDVLSDRLIDGAW